MKEKLVKWIRKFNNIKFRHKLVLTYFCVGVIPILVLGIFCYQQSRSQLMEREQNNIQDYMMQSVSGLDNQMRIYNNLSDYISYNQTIAQVVSYDYKSYYEMYQQFNEVLDPILSSLKYFHDDVNKVTIYTKNDIVKHDTTIAPISEIKGTDWYPKVENSREILWFADAGKKTVFSSRNMSMLKQCDCEGILYINVDYNSMFSNFSQMSSKNYGVYIVDDNGNKIYEYHNFDKKNRAMKLSYPQLFTKASSKYTIVHATTSVSGWKVYLYKPNSLIMKSVRSMVLGIILVAFVCIVTSLFAVSRISRFMVSGIEELTENMAKVEAGDMEINVTSTSEDEVGELICGFGNMLDQIKRLIREVYESKLAQKEYEMRALQAQINPHFLYNSLSLINWKALEADKQDISRITLLLSSFYRTALNRGKNILSIRDEVNNVKSYLDIQLIMHDYDFDVVIDVPEKMMEYKTLNLILQPLVENAIDHGIDLKPEGRGKISIIGKAEGENLYLIVEDNGVGMEQEKAEQITSQSSKGYGVRNVNERIKLLYGPEYCMKVESEIMKGTRITICIPAVKESE